MVPVSKVAALTQLAIASGVEVAAPWGFIFKVYITTVIYT